MLRRWLSGWSKWRMQSERPAAAVYLSPRSVAVAAGARQGDRYRVDLHVEPIAQLSEATARLREQARDLGVTDNECNLVLAPELYTVSLVERPPVPDEEVKEAVRWRIQDNVEFPVDQAAIDVFPLPPSASREKSMVFVVTMQMDVLKRLLDKVHSAGMRVGCVDVSELTLRNVTYGLYPEPEWSVGLLRLTAASGVINISRGDELFLSRRVSGVPAELSESAWEPFNDRLLLQVQRSIDYYESAMGQPPCNALIVATSHQWQNKVCDYLSEMLPVAVRSLADELGNLCDVRLHDPEPVQIDWAALGTRQHSALTAALPALGGLMRALADQQSERSAPVEAAA